KEEAFDIFASNQIEDEYMREHISEFLITESLLKDFYRDNEGYFFDDFGEYPERVRKLSKQQQDDYVNSWRNINTYWKDKPQFAAEYLRELNKANTDENYIGEFSFDFWVDTIKRVIQKGNWYRDFDIVKINLDE